jgi:hypothetical protein
MAGIRDVEQDFYTQNLAHLQRLRQLETKEPLYAQEKDFEEMCFKHACFLDYACPFTDPAKGIRDSSCVQKYQDSLAQTAARIRDAYHTKYHRQAATAEDACRAFQNTWAKRITFPQDQSPFRCPVPVSTPIAESPILLSSSIGPVAPVAPVAPSLPMTGQLPAETLGPMTWEQLQSQIKKHVKRPGFLTHTYMEETPLSPAALEQLFAEANQEVDCSKDKTCSDFDCYKRRPFPWIWTQCVPKPEKRSREDIIKGFKKWCAEKQHQENLACQDTAYNKLFG